MMVQQRYGQGVLREVTDAPIKKGDKVDLIGVDRKFTVIAVYPYTGKYTQWFKYTVRVHLPNSKSGWLEYCI